jgi:hypothetical protein
MSNKKRHSHIPQTKKSTSPHYPSESIQPVTSLLDHMIDGREFESLLSVKAVQLDLTSEIRRALSEISQVTKRYTIGYIANIVNSNIKVPISINSDDDLPFSEMIACIPNSVREIDIILVTPGGSAQQVAKFVDKLRPRFEKVNFILPNMAMSAGTIFSMSGDKIYMGPNSYIGPIDPQVPNKDGIFMPAQAILTLIDEIKHRGDALLKKGQNPPWTDLQLLKQMDPKEIGNAMNASNYSIELVKNFLQTYKFSSWEKHKTSGNQVTHEEKADSAVRIASFLCDHSQWKSHSRGITREEAWNECKLKIDHFEDTDGMEKAVRRLWALLYWAFERTPMAKLFEPPRKSRRAIYVSPAPTAVTSR